MDGSGFHVHLDSGAAEGARVSNAWYFGMLAVSSWFKWSTPEPDGPLPSGGLERHRSLKPLRRRERRSP